MATLPSQLTWLLVRNNNAFKRQSVNHTLLSAEAGNLYSKHSYKYSGLANDKTIDIRAVDDVVTLTKSRVKNASKPKSSRNSVSLKKHARRGAKAVAAEAQSFRPDLRKAAVARFSAVEKSLRVKKAAAKAK